MKNDLIALVEHFPLIRMQISESCIKMCKEAIKEAPFQIALLEAELSACGDEDEERQIISVIIGVHFHVELCRDHIKELNKWIKPYKHYNN